MTQMKPREKDSATDVHADRQKVRDSKKPTKRENIRLRWQNGNFYFKLSYSYIRLLIKILNCRVMNESPWIIVFFIFSISKSERKFVAIVLVQHYVPFRGH